MSQRTHVPRRPCFFGHFIWQPTAQCPYFEGLKNPILALSNGWDNLVVSWWEFRLLGKQSDQTGKSLFPAHCSNGGKNGNLALLGINCRLKRTPNILAAKEAPFALLAWVCRRRRHSCGRRSESRSNFMRNPQTPTPEGQEPLSWSNSGWCSSFASASAEIRSWKSRALRHLSENIHFLLGFGASWGMFHCVSCEQVIHQTICVLPISLFLRPAR